MEVEGSYLRGRLADQVAVADEDLVIICRDLRFAEKPRDRGGGGATGFELDHSFVQLPVFDTDGRLVHQRGVTASPGLYFLGMPWQHTRGSALLGWVKDDAQYLADQIATLASTGTSSAAPALAAQARQR